MEKEESTCKSKDPYARGLELLRLSLVLLRRNADETIQQRGLESFKDQIPIIRHDIIYLDYFADENKDNWSNDVKQMMSRPQYDYFLNQYRQDNLDVDTLAINMGKEVVGRIIVPLK
jgi:hypothetical protein